jgi:predicted DNA binding CopG/RHH family protein
MAKKKLADAQSEAEEAQWFEENEDRLLQLFEQAAKEGALRVGGRSVGITLSKETGAVLKPRSQKVMLRIPTDDLDRARRIAAGKGIGYQTYIKMLLRQGLDREEKRGTRAAR